MWTELKVSEADLELFLNRMKWLDSACEVCGAYSFAVRSDKDEIILLSMPYENDPGKASNFYSIICTTCGNSKLLDAGFVFHKVKELKTDERSPNPEVRRY